MKNNKNFDVDKYLGLLSGYELKDLIVKYKTLERDNPVFLDEGKFHIIRCDGAHFKTFTGNFKRPFDKIFRNVMEKTMIRLCNEFQCTSFGYTESDEISLLFYKPESKSQLPFSGRTRKIETTAASLTTLYFNTYYKEEVEMSKMERIMELINMGMSFGEAKEQANVEFKKYENKFNRAYFDGRCFSCDTIEDVQEYFIWRMKDAQRNSIQMIARCNFSNKSLHGVNNEDAVKMLLDKSIDIYKEYDVKNIFGVSTAKELQKLYAGTDRECDRMKFVSCNCLESVFDENFLNRKVGV